jgi:lipopolysaccharide biosynthesis protein
VVEFPPHGLRTVTMHEQLDLLDPEFRGTVVDYRQFVVDCVTTREPSYTLHRTVMPGWDNTARRMHQALVFAHASPEVYELWTRDVALQARRKPPGERLLFINAWNEWAEGAHLEPDRRFGHQYLAATQRALAFANAHDGELESALGAALRKE